MEKESIKIADYRTKLFKVIAIFINKDMMDQMAMAGGAIWAANAIHLYNKPKISSSKRSIRFGYDNQASPQLG